jgi:hypothetical protein
VAADTISVRFQNGTAGAIDLGTRALTSIDRSISRLCGSPENAHAVLNGTWLLSGPLSGSGRREFAAEVPRFRQPRCGATALLYVTVAGARVDNLAQASNADAARLCSSGR